MASIAFDKLLEEWEKDCPIDPNKIERETVKAASLHVKYLRLLMESKLLLLKRKDKYDKLRVKKWEYYTGRMTQSEMDQHGWPYNPFAATSKPLKSELNQYIETDSELSDLKLKIEHDKTIVEALEEIINTIRWRHSTIKNLIEGRKFEAGC
jgi:hypothetical protein